MCTSHDGNQNAAASSVTDSAKAPLAADPELIEDLVAANHILFDQGVLDAFGHVSVRHPQDPQRFLLCRNMAPALVAAGDIVQFELDGTPSTRPAVRCTWSASSTARSTGPAPM